jgi:hypothetical protein
MVVRCRGTCVLGPKGSLAKISLARVFEGPEPVSNITTGPNSNGVTATAMTFDLCGTCSNLCVNYFV